MALGDTHLTAAVTLLQCGPPLVLYICVIAPRSLLIMVTLARCLVTVNCKQTGMANVSRAQIRS